MIYLIRFEAKDSRLAEAYQSDSGTIIVPTPNDNVERPMESEKLPINALSSFIKKTVEFSNNNGSIEDFAAWVLSNFYLTENSDFFKNISKAEIKRRKQTNQEIQNHYKSLIQTNASKPDYFSPFPLGVGDESLAAQVEFGELADGQLSEEFVNEIGLLFNTKNSTYNSYKSGMSQRPELNPYLLNENAKTLDQKKEKSRASINHLGNGSFTKSEENELFNLKKDLKFKEDLEEYVKEDLGYLKKAAPKLIKKKNSSNSKNKKTK